MWDVCGKHENERTIESQSFFTSLLSRLEVKCGDPRGTGNNIFSNLFYNFVFEDFKTKIDSLEHTKKFLIYNCQRRFLNFSFDDEFDMCAEL